MRRPRIPAGAAGVLVGICGLVVGGCGGGSGGGAKPQGAQTAQHAAIAPGFVGLVSEDSFAAGPAQRRDILNAEKRTGVELLRQIFDWSQIEVKPGHYDFSLYDAWVEAVARAGMDVLPVLMRPPVFDRAPPQFGATVTATTIFPPSDLSAFARFATALAQRYGHNGSFWSTHPDVPQRPIRAWQVWNEPNLPVFWGGMPSAGAYVTMLRTVSAALHRVDPGAEVVTAGIPESKQGVPLERFVRQMLAAGARDTFDTFAVHPYAVTAAGALAAVRRVRGLLSAAGVHAPIWVTEVGWASDGPGSSFTVGPARQAALVLAIVTSLAEAARSLGVRGVVYFNWRDAKPFPGQKDFWGLHTGLLRLDGSGKPALSTYYQAAGVVAKLRAG